MIYNIRHRTVYAYAEAAGFARCALRLTPTSDACQTVLASTVTVTPKPAQSTRRLGPFGETVISVVVNAPHDSLVIEAQSRVERHAPSPGLGLSPPWEMVRTRALEGADLGPGGPAVYLFPSRHTPILPQIADYARQDFAPSRPILEAAMAFMNRIHADFRYEPGATTIDTPVAEAFAARRGVCQDFAQVMICGLHGLGLPAAYVSGYLRTTPPPGKPRLTGADATHAWVSVWCGEAEGWLGLDPTNALAVRNDHIELAAGRDYSDVAPIDGVILAPGDQSLKVEVDVIPETDAVK